MSTTARQIRSKINRAHENIDEFQARARAFYKANPHVVFGKEDAEAGKRVWHVGPLPEIPAALADVAADAIGNLCKPLDYIATQIEAAAGRVDLKGVYFPVGRDAANYVTQRRRYVKAARQAAVDAFDAAEPYKGGKGEALWQLHELNSPEKHRAPLALSGGFKAFDLGPIFRDQFRANRPDWMSDADIAQMPSLFVRPADRMCPLKEGDALFAEPIEPKMQETRQFLLQMSLDEPGIVDCEPALETLQKFADAVSGILTAFEPLLP